MILQNIEMETDMGKKAREMLYRGEAVAEEVVAKMIEDKINSPEVSTQRGSHSLIDWLYFSSDIY